MAIPFKTERLGIRLIEEGDWESVRQIWIDFQQSEYVLFDTWKDTDPGEVKRRISKWAELTRSGKEHLFFAICLAGEVIGYISMNRRENGYETGYGFLRKAQGKGYAREALEAVCRHMKSIGAERITAGTALKNRPSAALLNRLGFALTGTEQLAFYRDEEGNPVLFEGGLFEKIL